VIALAGLALLGSIAGGLAVAVRDDAQREAALITFLVTLSGLSLGGVGSAFWGLVAGGLALFVQQWRPRRRRDPPLP
jgi:benzoate membrane transport protein